MSAPRDAFLVSGDDMDRLMAVVSAARELVVALPKCEVCDAPATREFFGGAACEKCGSRSHRIEYADALEKLEVALMALREQCVNKLTGAA